ncbi:MAG: cation transporter, partial [Cyanobacteria bacterium P01_D01_bin.128]
MANRSTLTQHQIRLSGMACAACAISVEKAIRSVPGVLSGQVNFATEQATVEFDPAQTDLNQIQQAVIAAGYQATAVDHSALLNAALQDETKARSQRILLRKVIVGAIASAVLMIGGMPMMTGIALPVIPSWLHHPWLQWALTTPVMVWCGQEFWIGAWQALRRKSADMNTLVALGTGTAYLYSLYVTLFPRGLSPEIAAALYYESAAVIITLILLGRWLEHRARRKTADAIAQLVGLQPKTAQVMRSGRFIDIPIAEVQVGDRILVRPGEKIP